MTLFELLDASFLVQCIHFFSEVSHRRRQKISTTKGTKVREGIFPFKAAIVFSTCCTIPPNSNELNEPRSGLVDGAGTNSEVPTDGLRLAARDSVSHGDAGAVGFNDGADHHSRRNHSAGVRARGKRNLAGICAGDGRDPAGCAVHRAIRAAFGFPGIALHVCFDDSAAMAFGNRRVEFAAGVCGHGIKRDRRLLSLCELACCAMPPGMYSRQCLLSLVVTGVSIWIAWRDVKISARLMLWIEAASVSVIVILVALLLFRHGWHWDSDELHLHGMTGSGLRLGLVLALFSYVGFESATTLGRGSATIR